MQLYVNTGFPFQNFNIEVLPPKFYNGEIGYSLAQAFKSPRLQVHSVPWLPRNTKKEQVIEPHPVCRSSCQSNEAVEAFYQPVPLTCFNGPRGMDFILLTIQNYVLYIIYCVLYYTS
jgi:hypothetical protein